MKPNIADSQIVLLWKINGKRIINDRNMIFSSFVKDFLKIEMNERPRDVNKQPIYPRKASTPPST